VAPRTVVLTHDTESEPRFWLLDYFPRILAHDRLRMPPLGSLCTLLDAQAMPLPVPHDCIDGFLGAYWRTPERYLDARVRSAMSAFAMLSEEELARGLQRLEADLASGAWTGRYGWLLGLDALDLGYRLVMGTRG
jgi:hypothetical protein